MHNAAHVDPERTAQEISQGDDSQKLGEEHRAAAALLARHVVVIPDFPLHGVRYLDHYRTFERYPAVRAAVIDLFAHRYATCRVDGVAAIANGALGLGGALAYALRVPLHPIRKAGDTVHDAHTVTVPMVYAGRELTLATDIVERGSRVLLVDDSIATGGSVRGGIQLLEQAGADVIEVATVFETTSRGGRAAIAPTPLFSVLSAEAF